MEASQLAPLSSSGTANASLFTQTLGHGSLHNEASSGHAFAFDHYFHSLITAAVSCCQHCGTVHLTTLQKWLAVHTLKRMTLLWVGMQHMHHVSASSVSSLGPYCAECMHSVPPQCMKLYGFQSKHCVVLHFPLILLQQLYSAGIGGELQHLQTVNLAPCRLNLVQIFKCIHIFDFFHVLF